MSFLCVNNPRKRIEFARKLDELKKGIKAKFIAEDGGDLRSYASATEKPFKPLITSQEKQLERLDAMNEKRMQEISGNQF